MSFDGVCVQIIPDQKSEKVTEIDVWLGLPMLSPKQFSLSIYGMSVISDVSNTTR